MIGNNSEGDRQAQASALAVAPPREERLEQMFLHLGCHAAAIVGDGKHRLAVAVLDFNGDRAPRVEAVQSVDDEIEHHLLNLHPVDEHQIHGWIEGEANANIMFARADQRKRARFFDQLGQAFDGALGFAARDEIAQPPDDVARA